MLADPLAIGTCVLSAVVFILGNVEVGKEPGIWTDSDILNCFGFKVDLVCDSVGTTPLVTGSGGSIDTGKTQGGAKLPLV